ncbi:molybdopterin guanine dinucleotide synthesis [Palleronia sp. KMU-117]|uniref:molybdopterin guanine dinucleotide synthesis n=1 Tax=Palleronia sp. KMU-117 TaxID=3434108 RepID=UPI003D733A8A
MTAFDTVVMVDWSAAARAPRRPRPDAIFAAVARGGQVAPAEYLGHRLDAEGWIAALIDDERRAGRRLLVGFDFPFGYPRGFSRALVGRSDPFVLWDWLDARIVDTPGANNRFEVAGAINAHFPGIGPFWGNGTPREVPHLPRKGRARTTNPFPERRAIEERHKGAFTLWQLSGAGAVGSQTVMGLPVLARLRRRFGTNLSVWPFEAPDAGVVLAEVWPSLLAPVVAAELAAGGGIKDARQVEVLARALSALTPDQMARVMDVSTVHVAAEEGWILGSGHEALLIGAHAASR